MTNALNDMASNPRVRKTIEQIQSERAPADDERLRQTDQQSQEALMRQALSDPDNLPLTPRQIEQVKRGEPVTEDAAGLLLLRLEYGDYSDAQLMEVIQRVADILRRRMAGSETHRKAG